MLNAYVDVGTWNRITPYVGAGIGAAYVNTSNKKSFNPDGSSPTYDGDNGQWNFAWALMAGAEYAFTPNWSLDAGYRYKNLGEAKSVKLVGVGSGGTRERWEDLTAHEFRLGARYNFNTTSAPTYYEPQGPITSNF